jgi:hypothetical protein
VSLVLEALRKLDREKNRDERGFVVMAAAPWPARAAGRGPMWAAVAVVVVALACAVFVMRWPRPSPPAGSAPSAAATPLAREAAAAPPASTLAPAFPPAARRPGTVAPAVRKRSASTDASASASVSAPPLRLQAVSERDGQPIAMVNDRLLRVGDEIGGMRVLAIRPDEVDVEINGRRTTLRF